MSNANGTVDMSTFFGKKTKVKIHVPATFTEHHGRTQLFDRSRHTTNIDSDNIHGNRIEDAWNNNAERFNVPMDAPQVEDPERSKAYGPNAKTPYDIGPRIRERAANALIPGGVPPTTDPMKPKVIKNYLSHNNAHNHLNNLFNNNSETSFTDDGRGSESPEPSLEARPEFSHVKSAPAVPQWNGSHISSDDPQRPPLPPHAPSAPSYPDHMKQPGMAQFLPPPANQVYSNGIPPVFQRVDDAVICDNVEYESNIRSKNFTNNYVEDAFNDNRVTEYAPSSDKGSTKKG